MESVVLEASKSSLDQKLASTRNDRYVFMEPTEWCNKDQHGGVGSILVADMHDQQQHP